MTEATREDGKEQIEISNQPEVKEEPEAETSEKSMTVSSRLGKRPGKRGRKPSKVDVKVKLERSRQSARECRARKKLRYQYLEELVSSRERAIFALRDELEQAKDWCIKLDKGQTPKEIGEYLAREKKTDSSMATTAAPRRDRRESPSSGVSGTRSSKRLKRLSSASSVSTAPTVSASHVELPVGITLSQEQKKQLHGSLLEYLGPCSSSSMTPDVSSSSKTPEVSRHPIGSTNSIPPGGSRKPSYGWNSRTTASATVTTATVIVSSSDEDNCVVSSTSSVQQRNVIPARKEQTIVTPGMTGKSAKLLSNNISYNPSSHSPTKDILGVHATENVVSYGDSSILFTNPGTTFDTDRAATCSDSAEQQFPTIDFTDLQPLPITDVIQQYLQDNDDH